MLSKLRVGERRGGLRGALLVLCPRRRGDLAERRVLMGKWGKMENPDENPDADEDEDEETRAMKRACTGIE